MIQPFTSDAALDELARCTQAAPGSEDTCMISVQESSPHGLSQMVECLGLSGCWPRPALESVRNSGCANDASGLHRLGRSGSASRQAGSFAIEAIRARQSVCACVSLRIVTRICWQRFAARALSRCRDHQPLLPARVRLLRVRAQGCVSNRRAGSPGALPVDLS